ncbi:hypothetical protein [Symbiobacterium thermophilum]|uniref:Lipoprotein n=1 Tax=Symbiobacterium thermophilum TaxID=2734 RepID=A0A953I9L9_SYMTR|nr:hypothetical protein [Symbiobacterium thermophilum]MBY6276948.1 hypothetical protein [Symbiobacterium thermophilum]
MNRRNRFISRINMRHSLVALVISAGMFLIGCNTPQVTTPTEVQLIPSDVPPNLEPRHLDEVNFSVEPILRVLQHPAVPNTGLAAVKVVITSHASETLENVHAAVWLPQEVFRYTPRALMGTNLDPGMWDVDLTPEQPKMALLTYFEFNDFSRRDEIIAAFNGDSTVRVLWDGGDVLFTFPADLWEVEVIEDVGPIDFP